MPELRVVEPCVVCGGLHCHGLQAGKYIGCTAGELAGKLKGVAFKGGTAWPHRAAGPCPCGTEHGAARVIPDGGKPAGEASHLPHANGNGAEHRSPAPLRTPLPTSQPAVAGPLGVPAQKNSANGSLSEKRAASAGASPQADLERRVLGALLLAPEKLAGLNLRGDAFTVGVHRLIFEAMRAGAHDLVTLAQALTGKVGIGTIARLADEPTAAFVETHAAQLLDAAMRREVVRAAEHMLSRADELTGLELVDFAKNALGVWEARPASTLAAAFERAKCDMAAMISTPPKPREWLIDDLILRGKVGTLVAPGGTGKGHLAMQVALALATGEWLGPFRVPRACGVLWLSREDDTDEQQRRLQDGIAARWRCKADAERDALIARHLRLVDLTEEADARIDNPDFARLIVELGKATQNLALIIIDPLSLVIPDRPDFDMNSVKGAKEIHAFAKAIAAALGCAVMLVHHTNKGAARGGTELEANAAAGSKQIVDLARWNINAKALSGEDAAKLGLERRHRYLEIEPPKNNYAPPLGERCIWKRSHGGALIHVPLETVSLADCARLLTLLGELGSATSAEWEVAAGKLQPPISRRSFERARDAVLREQRIEVAPHEGPKRRGQQPIRYRICQ